MTVYLSIETHQGIVHHTRVFLSESSARQAEQNWLEENGITDDDHRNAKSGGGTEFIVLECTIEP